MIRRDPETGLVPSTTTRMPGRTSRAGTERTRPFTPLTTRPCTVTTVTCFFEFLFNPNSSHVLSVRPGIRVVVGGTPRCRGPGDVGLPTGRAPAAGPRPALRSCRPPLPGPAPAGGPDPWRRIRVLRGARERIAPTTTESLAAAAAPAGHRSRPRSRGPPPPARRGLGPASAAGGSGADRAADCAGAPRPRIGRAGPGRARESADRKGPMPGRGPGPPGPARTRRAVRRSPARTRDRPYTPSRRAWRPPLLPGLLGTTPPQQPLFPPPPPPAPRTHCPAGRPGPSAVAAIDPAATAAISRPSPCRPNAPLP